MKKLFYVLMGLCLVAPVGAQGIVDSQTRALIDRMDRLERDLTLVQRKIYKSSDASQSEEASVSAAFPQGSVEHLYAKITELEQVVAHLTAQVEETNASLTALDGRVSKLSQDVDFRLTALENAPKPTSTEKQAKAAPSAVTDVVVTQVNPADAQKDYDAAYALLKKAQYEEAETALKAFLKNYPSDKLAGNAQYWLGETYYVRGRFDQAAVTFAEGVQKYKENAKGADSLLKLGMSMARLNKTKEACTAFKNLEKEFPKASEALKARAKSEMDKISCASN